MNRMIYDDCAFEESVKQSVTPMHYVLDPIKYEHCSPCSPGVGMVGGTSVSHINGNLVDLENNLMGIDRPATLCPKYKFSPVPAGSPLQGKEYIKPVCHPKIDTTMKHLPKCPLSSYPAVPDPPAPKPYRC